LSAGFVGKIDPVAGNLIWSTPFEDAGSGEYGAPIVSGGIVWAVGTRDGRILAMDGATGEPIWHGASGDLTPPDSAPLVIGDRMITVGYEGQVRVFQSGL